MARLINADELIDIVKGTDELLDFQKEELISCVNACDTVDDEHNKAIRDFSEQLKISTENMFGQRYVDIRTVEEIEKQLSNDNTKQATIDEFAEWVFYFVDGYHFSSKEEMLAEWNKHLKG